MRPLALATAFVALVAVSAPARQKDDEFRIIVANPRVNEKVDVTINSTITTTLTVTNKGEKKIHTEKVTRDFEYTDEILAAIPFARLPTKLKRTYGKAVIDTGSGTEAFPAQKQTITIEKLGDEFTYKYGNKSPLTQKDKVNIKAELDIEFNTLNRNDLRDIMFPEGLHVKNGASWDINGKTLARTLFQDVFKFDEGKIKATGKVDNAKPEAKKDKKPQTAKVVVKLEAPITQFVLEKGVTVKAKDTSKVVATVDGEGRIDGFSPDGKVTITATINVSGTTAEGAEVEFVITSTETRVIKLVEKKDKN